METEQMIFSIHGRFCEGQAVSEPFAAFFPRYWQRLIVAEV